MTLRSKLLAIARQLGVGGTSVLTVPRLKDVIDRIHKVEETTGDVVIRAPKMAEYTRKRPLGKPGKEGTTYLVTDKDGREYAMKTFRSTKSPARILQEARFQQEAWSVGAAPRVYEINLVDKYILMHPLELGFKYIKLDTETQQQLIDLHTALHTIQLVHNDGNPGNLMISRSGGLYLIDFGFTRRYTREEIKTPQNHSAQIGAFGLLIYLIRMNKKTQTLHCLLDTMTKDQRRMIRSYDDES